MPSNYGTAHTVKIGIGHGNTVSLGTLLGIISALTSSGCLDRPIEQIEPETHNVFLTRTRSTKVDKIDVLFMIDNSLSMADKQQVLAAAVPQLLRRLTSPDCINPNDPAAAPIPMDNPTAACSGTGFEREFAPVSDIHIGIITSSLGDYGGYICNDKPTKDDAPDLTRAFEAAKDDKAYLLGALPRAALGSPFLSWTPNNAASFGSSITAKESEFRNFVTTAGEHGCGYEMNLESWYRFLVDPEPPTAVDKVTYADNGVATARSGQIDQNILNQRKQFLRPDSLLAIVMLTDENDCSLKDSGASLLLTDTKPKLLKGGSAACKTSPNDPCCYSCDFGGPPAGCAVEPNCTGDNPAVGVDVGNLRCFDQKKRYGYDYLFPTNRYVNALRLKTICPYQNYGSLDCDCAEEKKRGIADCVAGQSFQNPIFDPTYSGATFNGDGRTEPDMVFLAGIVGVPWQDIAKTDALAQNAELRYQLSSAIDWDLVLPRADGTPARDPLMREQVEPRTGTHPITNEQIGLPTSATQRQLNAINWHDWVSPGEDLQYACVFDMTQPLSDGATSAARDCAAACPAGDNMCLDSLNGCPCTGKKTNPNDPNSPMVYPESPLCQAADGTYGSIQYAAKAYPGTRQLEVLRGHNSTSKDNSIVASICPKDLNWSNRLGRGYGYNPAVQALVDRLKTKLTATCLPRQLVQEEGKLPCAVVEAIPPGGTDLRTCTEKRRDDVDPAVRTAVLNGMRGEALCDTENHPECAGYTLCQLRQLTDDMDPAKPLTQCLNAVGFETTSPVPGFCYVDPAQNIGSASIVKDCPVNRQRMLRIVGDNDKLRAPAPGSWTFIACAGSPYVVPVPETNTSGQ